MARIRNSRPTQEATDTRSGGPVRLVAPLRLASASPRRAEILRSAGYRFEIDPAGTAEPVIGSGAGPGYAVDVATAKAAEVAGRHSDEIVLAADTVVLFRNRALGKPSGPSEAIETLKALRGRAHAVVTAVAIDGRLGRRHGTRLTEVGFREYTDAEIEAYVASGRPMDKAGSYGIQDQPFSPAALVRGCYLNVVGLPLCLTGELLEDAGAFPPGASPPACPQCGEVNSK
ncbi:MAG: septum formation protein Maf [Chloroflexi bacterium]|nr:septum formation protein Maf [Chloroflexota bacterium]